MNIIEQAPTVSDIIAKVCEVAAANPHTVYERVENPWDCALYVHPDGSPGCGIGHALCELGIADASWYSEDDDRVINTHAIRDLLVNDLSRIGIVKLTDADAARRIGWLSVFQRANDNGTEWGEAVRLADLAYPGAR